MHVGLPRPREKGHRHKLVHSLSLDFDVDRTALLFLGFDMHGFSHFEKLMTKIKLMKFQGIIIGVSKVLMSRVSINNANCSL